MSLQKFKLLATHCSTVAESPTRSPVIHLRRRKTLRFLLTRSSDRWLLPYQPDSYGNRNGPAESAKPGGTRQRDKIRSRRKLGELFVSSPPPDESNRGGCGDSRKEMERDSPVNGVNINGNIGQEATARRIGFNGPIRPMSSATLRCRLLRRAWRPVLVTIPEQQ